MEPAKQRGMIECDERGEKEREREGEREREREQNCTRTLDNLQVESVTKDSTYWYSAISVTKTFSIDYSWCVSLTNYKSDSDEASLVSFAVST